MKKIIAFTVVIVIMALIIYSLLAYGITLQIAVGSVLLIAAVFLCVRIFFYRTTKSEGSL